MTPEIVLGTAFFLVFVHLLTFIQLGTMAQAIGHITFSLVFVLIIVRGRLLAIGPEYEEAARDLGASQLQAVRLALLPMLVPAIVASGIVVFAISMDDFVITQFLSSGTNTDTVPVRIYADRADRADARPERARDADAGRHGRDRARRISPLEGGSRRPRPDRLCRGGLHASGQLAALDPPTNA